MAELANMLAQSGSTGHGSQTLQVVAAVKRMAINKAEIIGGKMSIFALPPLGRKCWFYTPFCMNSLLVPMID
jgi:hypothetical protein